MVYVTNQLGKKYSFDEYKDILMQSNECIAFNFPCPRAEVRDDINSLVLINKENPEECLVVGVKLVIRKTFFCYLESNWFVDYSDDRKNTAYFICSNNSVGLDFIGSGSWEENVSVEETWRFLECSKLLVNLKDLAEEKMFKNRKRKKFHYSKMKKDVYSLIA